MSISTVNYATPSTIVAYTSSAMGNTVEGIKASSTRLYSLVIDNSLNNAATYVKLYNVASGSVVLGTTAPDEIIYVPASAIITVPYYTSANPGKVFGTALSAAAVTAGGTAGTTSPSSACVVTANYV